MHALDHKIPPPAVALAMALLMWWLARVSPGVEVPAALRIATAALVAAVGVAFGIASAVAFRKAKTTVNPFQPERATTLVRTGVYRITRNPMYAGMALALLSWAIYLASPLALLGMVLFVAYITAFQIKPEERALSARFGQAYAQYLASVRRWL